MPFISTMESLTATGSATLTNKTIVFTNNTINSKLAYVRNHPSNPAATGSATYVQMGCAVAFTPKLSGKCIVTITGNMYNGTVNGQASQAKGSYGTGTAPVNGAAITGTAFGCDLEIGEPVISMATPYTISDYITGLTVGTAYWFDVNILSNTVTNSTTNDLVFVIQELLPSS